MYVCSNDLRHLVDDEESRFYLKTKGVLDKAILRKKGLKQLPTQAQCQTGRITEDQFAWTDDCSGCVTVPSGRSFYV